MKYLSMSRDVLEGGHARHSSTRVYPGARTRRVPVFWPPSAGSKYTLQANSRVPRGETKPLTDLSLQPSLRDVRASSPPPPQVWGLMKKYHGRWGRTYTANASCVHLCNKCVSTPSFSFNIMLPPSAPRGWLRLCAPRAVRVQVYSFSWTH